MQNLQTLLAKVKKSYQIGLLLIIILLSCSFLAIGSLTNAQKNDAKLINMAGKQRMLSQKLMLNITKYEQAKNINSSTRDIEPIIKQIANQLYANHLFLINATDPLSTAIRHYYFKTPEPLHHQIKTFSDNAIKLLVVDEKAITILMAMNFTQEKAENLLVQLDHIVNLMEEKSAEQLQLIENSIYLLWLGTLISFILFVFYSFRRISSVATNSYKKLKTEKHKVADFEFAINKHSIVFRVDLDHKIKYVNEKFCALYGYSSSEILGQHQGVLGSKEHPKSLFEEMHQHIERGEIWKHELCNLDHKGWKYWLDTTVVPILHNDKVLSYMVIQNDITEQKLMGFALAKTHEIIADPHRILAEKINHLLALGSELFHLPLGIVSEISGTIYKVQYAHSPNKELLPGTTFDLLNTYCIHTLKANKPISFEHVAESEIRNHPCYQNFGLESYIGCPILVDGERYGTLNFSSPEIHNKKFSGNDLELIQLMAQWIGYELMREKHQANINSQQNLMEQMSKQARIGAWEIDLLSNRITWSAMTKAIHEVPMHYQPDMLTAVNFYKEGENRDKITSYFDQAINEGKPFKDELELITAKGNSIWVATRGNAIFDNEKCVKLYGSFQDISDIKKAKEEAIENNRRMGIAADSAGIGVWEYNILTNELKWDDWMLRLYGVNPEHFSGAYEAWQDGLHPDDMEYAVNELELAIAGKKKFDIQFRVIKPSGSICYMKADAVVLRDKSGKPHTMVGVNYDVTDRVETEIALTQAKEIAEKASKVKNEFLASMSHEIRTPMNGVVGMLDLLADSKLTKDQQHKLSVAKSSAESLLFLINDILDFSKIDANKLELEELVFDINLLLSEFVDAMMPQAQQKGLELIVDTVAITESLVVGDPNRIRQILTNLVSNAIKFTAKGEVVIKLSLRPDTLNTWRLTIKVEDTGIGIAKANQDYLFQSFQQVDSSTTRKFGGTGLGLAIVKKLCQCMNGDVSLISDIGEGCIFICDIRVGKTTQITANLPISDISALTVLVVDDNETNREVISKQLNKWHIDVTCVESAAEALTLCKNIVELGHQKLFDVAILDMQMPNMDGAELGKILRADQRFNSMKLVMMTSMHADGGATFFANLGFSAYFSKPATSSDLFNTLNIIADNGSVLEKANPLITKHYIKALNHSEVAATKAPSVQWPATSKVLLVEDNRVNQMVAKGLLDKISIPCEIAVNGQDALDKLSAEGSDFSLILMDCQMPVMDGYQATIAIRQGSIGENYRNIPIIAMTANAMQGDREKCLEAGMSDYLAKPIDKDLVVEKLTQWLN